MKPVTLATVQLIISLFALILVGVLQSLAAFQLKHEDKYSATRQKLITGSIISLVGVSILIVFGVLLWSKKDRILQHVPILVNISLLIAGVLLLVSGGYSSAAAIDLQCEEESKFLPIHRNASFSAIVGIVGAFLLLVTQAFIQKSTVKKILGPDIQESRY